MSDSIPNRVLGFELSIPISLIMMSLQYGRYGKSNYVPFEDTFWVGNFHIAYILIKYSLCKYIETHLSIYFHNDDLIKTPQFQRNIGVIRVK